MKHCKKRSGSVEVLHYSNSNELPEIWDDFLPKHHFLQSEHLKVTEQSSLPNLSFIYLLVLEDGVPKLAAGFQILQLKANHVNSKMVQPIQHFGWKMYTAVIRPKLLIGGHLFRHDVRSLYFSNDLSDFNAYELYHKAIDLALSHTCASAVLIKDMPEPLAKYFTNYQPQYMMLRNDISMEMVIDSDWQSIDDYETALKHKYAQRFRKIRAPWEQLSIKEFDVEDTEQHSSAIYDLYTQVTEHQQVRIGLLSEDFIPQLKKAYPEQLKVWGIYSEGELIGFFSAWLKENAFDMFYIGFDYEKNRTYSLYFNILFFAIEQSIKHKKPKLILGRTALDAKARIGCKPNYLSTFLYIKNRFIRQRVVQAQKNTSDKEGAWESRHPFGKQNKK